MQLGIRKCNEVAADSMALWQSWHLLDIFIFESVHLLLEAQKELSIHMQGFTGSFKIPLGSWYIISPI